MKHRFYNIYKQIISENIKQYKKITVEQYVNSYFDKAFYRVQSNNVVQQEDVRQFINALRDYRKNTIYILDIARQIAQSYQIISESDAKIISYGECLKIKGIFQLIGGKSLAKNVAKIFYKKFKEYKLIKNLDDFKLAMKKIQTKISNNIYNLNEELLNAFKDFQLIANGVTKEVMKIKNSKKEADISDFDS